MLLLVPVLRVGLVATSSPIPSEYAQNITVFHVNPEQYGVAPINMDTADLLGDMYFDMRSVFLPMECANGTTIYNQHDCENAEVTANDLVITKLVLEIDSRVGEYGRCNICVNGSDHHGNNSCVNGVYDCSCGDFSKQQPCGAPVGAENVSLHNAGRGCSTRDPTYDCWKSAVSRKTGGMWYSTTASGYCGDGTSPAPAGCTWRVAEFVKRVNKTCSDNSIYNEVEKVDGKQSEACFPSCHDSGIGAQRNTSSSCWITCFYNTVLGPDASKPHGTVTGMPLSDLVTAWNLPFESNDPTRGGCKALQP